MINSVLRGFARQPSQVFQFACVLLMSAPFHPFNVNFIDPQVMQNKQNYDTIQQLTLAKQHPYPHPSPAIVNPTAKKKELH